MVDLEGGPSRSKVSAPTYMRSLSPWPTQYREQQQSRLFSSRIPTPSSIGDGSKPEIPSIAREDLDPTPTASLSSPTTLGEGEINVMAPTPSLIHSVLGNFALTLFTISLTLFAIFFAVTWFTVFRDARLMKGQVFSDANGVSLYVYMLR